ncbi:MAG TPA: hypothetical protein VFE53_19055 [Mucilaginibacter sp.]|jgi:hypothetical protein|nr:hypothetical protein [Mucilaginibacter sp.]
MMRQFLFFMLLSGLISTACAQDQFTGRVYENKSNTFLQGIRVEDLKSHVMTMTGPDGSFTIRAAVGDLVCFTNSNYKPDTLYLANLKYVQVFLDPRINQLQEVTVTNQEIKKNAGFTTQKQPGVLGSETVLYQTDANGNPIGGLKMNIADGGETPKQHETKVAKNEAQKDQIRRVFNAENLKKYLPITGQEMENFIILYTPDINTYFTPAFNLVAYLNTSFEEFNKIPADQRQSKSLTQLVPDKN